MWPSQNTYMKFNENFFKHEKQEFPFIHYVLPSLYYLLCFMSMYKAVQLDIITNGSQDDRMAWNEKNKISVHKTFSSEPI